MLSLLFTPYQGVLLTAGLPHPTLVMAFLHCPMKTPSCFDVHLQPWPVLQRAPRLRIAALKLIYSRVTTPVTRTSSHKRPLNQGRISSRSFQLLKNTGKTDFALFSTFPDFSPYAQMSFIFHAELTSEFKVTSLGDHLSHSTNEGKTCRISQDTKKFR